MDTKLFLEALDEGLRAWGMPDKVARLELAHLLAQHLLRSGLTLKTLDNQDTLHGQSRAVIDAARRLMDAMFSLVSVETPVDMVLYCPACGKQHIDKAADSSAQYMASLEGGAHPSWSWTNPPHRSHQCQYCGCEWRPADVATNGVAATQTRGKKDTWPAAAESSSTPAKTPTTHVPVEVVQEYLDALKGYEKVSSTREYIGPSHPVRVRLQNAVAALDAAMKGTS